MNFTYRLAEFIDWLVFRAPQPPYWLEIKTQNPDCTYYFGHFDTPLAARLMQHGYIKDLIEEEAIVVSIELKQCEPIQLTIVDTEKKS